MRCFRSHTVRIWKKADRFVQINISKNGSPILEAPKSHSPIGPTSKIADICRSFVCDPSPSRVFFFFRGKSFGVPIFSGGIEPHTSKPPNQIGRLEQSGAGNSQLVVSISRVLPQRVGGLDGFDSGTPQPKWAYAEELAVGYFCCFFVGEAVFSSFCFFSGKSKKQRMRFVQTHWRFGFGLPLSVLPIVESPFFILPCKCK